MVEKKEPSAVVIPFGKHKGSTVAEVLARDPQYAEWLLGQGWLAERFAELHAAILSRGAATDDSPEHNVIQARFLDPVFQVAFVLAMGTKLDDYRTVAIRQGIDWMRDPEMRQLDNQSAYASDQKYAEIEAKREERRRQILAATPISTHLNMRATFEQRGIDVVLVLRFTPNSPYDQARDGYAFFSPNSYGVSPDSPNFSHSTVGRDWKIEIKPSLGDDFPAVMRQMARLGAWVLVIDRFAAVVPLETVRAMFQANHIRLITVREIEAEIANARAMLA